MEETKKARVISTLGITSLGFGLLFHYLFYGKHIGVSVPIFTTLLIAVVAIFYSYFLRKKVENLWLGIPLLVFGITPAIRDNSFLSILNILAVLGLFVLMLREATGFKVKSFGIRDYISTVLSTPVNFVARTINLTSALNETRPNLSRGGTPMRILRGLIFAVPVLFLFVVLFASADSVFQSYVDILFSFFSFEIPSNWFGHFWAFVMGVYLAAGSLSSLFFEDKSNETKKEDVSVPKRRIEMATVLSSIALLFLVFIIIQIAYLFGGEANITRLGLTYAEYARHGFWELIAVALVTLSLLIVAERESDKTKVRDSIFALPALVIVAEVLVIIISAYKRLGLYIFAYGETTLRFYVGSTILFLFVVFLILGFKIFNSKRESFLTFGILITLILFMLGINLVNPDAFIAHKNFELYRKTGKIDMVYLSDMSADAIPEFLRNKDQLTTAQREDLLGILQSKKEEFEEAIPWQSYNHSRGNAVRLLRDVEKPLVRTEPLSR